jgi:WD40 repeat protein
MASLEFTPVNVSPDGQKMVYVPSATEVTFLDVQTGNQLQKIVTRHGKLMCVKWSKDSSCVAGVLSENSRYTVVVWSAADGGQRCQPASLGAIAEPNFVFNNALTLLAAGVRNGSIVVWAVELSGSWTIRTRMRGHASPVICICILPDDTQIVSGSEDGTLRVWNARSGVQIRVLLRIREKVTSVVCSPDGRNIFSGSFDHIVRKISMGPQVCVRV